MAAISFCHVVHCMHQHFEMDDIFIERVAGENKWGTFVENFETIFSESMVIPTAYRYKPTTEMNMQLLATL